MTNDIYDDGPESVTSPQLPAIDGWYPGMVQPGYRPPEQGEDIEDWTDRAMDQDDLVAILRALPEADRERVIGAARAD